MKKLLYTLAALAALVSCSESVSEFPEGQLRFQFSLPGTRATSSAFETGDAVSLYAVAYNSGNRMPLQTGGNWLNNEKVTYDGSDWNPARTLYWSEAACDFYAFYPFQPSIGSMEKYPFSVAVNQNSARTVSLLGGYEASDLMYACAENLNLYQLFFS